MIGVEIYNESGGLYYSSKNPPQTSLLLYRVLNNHTFRTIPTPPFGSVPEYYDTGIPNNYSCMVFSAFRGGDPGAITSRRGPNGYWQIYSLSWMFDFESTDTADSKGPRPPFDKWYVNFDVYIFSNYQSGPIVPKNQYGIVIYDENGVAIRDADTKNLEMKVINNPIKDNNLSTYIDVGHPVATMALPIDGIFIAYFYPSIYGYAFSVGSGNRIIKHCVYGSASGDANLMDQYWNTIVYINTNHYI